MDHRHLNEKNGFFRALYLTWLPLSLILSACGSSLVGQVDQAGVPRDLGQNDAMVASGAGSVADAHPQGVPRITQNCQSSKSGQTCLALKYVVFDDSNGNPVVNEGLVQRGVAAINKIWEQCQIQFQVEQFLSVDPSKYGLAFHTSENSDLEEIRKTFMDSSSLLVVTTGKWDRSGSLGYTGANAWTSMPGETFYGAVLEAPVGDYPNIIAHELGHYLNLDHAHDTEQLMNPVIYERSKSLTRSECRYAFNSVQDYWKAMLR